MKEFKIQITDTDVYINGKPCKFDYLMDKYGLTPEKIASKIEASL